MALTLNPAMQQQFLSFLNEQQLCGPTDFVLLAVSGGLDSVVMTHLFRTAGLRFGLAHVNFSLRGIEADGDEAFVRDLAAQYEVPFLTTRFDTAAYAAEQGVSIQMGARTLRYDWFERCRAEQGYTRIATAHQQNDVFETLLLNLTRGTGLAGLHGIPVRQGNLIRPLWFASRDDLETYAVQQQLVWREDASNADDKYARNRIRHHVVPVLQALNPGLMQTLPTTVERLRAAETLMRTELDQSWQTTADQQGETYCIDLKKLRRLPEPAFRLAEWLRPFGFTVQQAKLIWKTAGQESGQEFHSATHRLIHEPAGLVLAPVGRTERYSLTLAEWPVECVTISDQLTITFETFERTEDFQPAADLTIASLDADRLTGSLTIRTWQPGDRFRPLGLGGSKLVSDFLNDLKLTRLEREQTLVLLADNTIAWVVGKRIDHRFRITNQTRRIVRMTVSTPLS